MRTQQCLNGWWDFAPYESKDNTAHQPLFFPQESWWQKDRIIVPGSWTRGGALYTEEEIAQRPWYEGRIYDNYGYPAHWDAMNTAWYRRFFDLPDTMDKKRWRLRFEGILRESWVVLNGTTVAHRTNGIMPFVCDITECVTQRDNELIVYVTDYERDENARAFTPTGSDQMECQKGIWQDVYLESVPACYVDDVTIRTSVRHNSIWLHTRVCNTDDTLQHVRIRYIIKDHMREVRTFDGGEIEVPQDDTVQKEARFTFSSYIPWSPQTPHLYTLEVRLEPCTAHSHEPIDSYTERFGFREVWIEGHHVMLNGSPLHLSGEWCHKHSLENFRPEYIRQWYRMLKDMNMNYIRTHTFPHPRLLLDIADEMGIVVCVEAGWQFGHDMALDKQRLWDNAYEHAREIIARDKNHPSVVFWSVANETRWCHNRNAIINKLPGLRSVYEELDPTRIPYHEGDSSLWDERTQHMLSRHYGTECTGEDWWNKEKPLHVGEVGKWHYGQPIDNTLWGNEEIFASFCSCHQAVAREAADIIEQARANEVACIFPWNISGLDNYRPCDREHLFEYPEPGTPHVKPLRSGAYGSEFKWWEPDSKGYEPGPSFDIIKNAYRPCALVIRQKRNHVFDDATLAHTVTCVNDTGDTLQARLECVLWYGAEKIGQWSRDVTVVHGHTQRLHFDIACAPVEEKTHCRIETRLETCSQVLDVQQRTCAVYPAAMRSEKWDVARCAVFGEGPVKEILESHGVSTVTIDSLEDADPAAASILCVEKKSLQAGSSQHEDIKRFAAQGGRVVIMEQSACCMPQTSLENKPAEQCHVRGGRDDIMKGFDDGDFAYWGDDPYGKTNSDAFVTITPYKKPGCGMSRVLIDSGWGDFGHGGLNWAPCVQTFVETGVVTACQLRVSDTAGTHPASLRFLRRLFEYSSSYESPQWRKVAAYNSRGAQQLENLGIATDSAGSIVYAAGGCDADAVKRLCDKARSGSTVILSAPDGETLQRLGRESGIDIAPRDLGPQYNVVKWRDDALFDGLSNQELYWLDKAHYGPVNTENRLMTDVLIDADEKYMLLSSEYDSCWREFYTADGKSERFRMPVITRYLAKGHRSHAAAMIRVPLGSGELFVCQVPGVEDAYQKARVFWTHVFTNLYARSTLTLFDGEKVVAGSQCSNGYPDYIWMMTHVDRAVREKVISVAAPREYRIPNQSVKESFRWEMIDTGRGTIPAEGDNAAMALMYEVRPGRSRKAVQVEGGLPNPQLQTLLDVTTCGEVEVYINGVLYEKRKLQRQERTTIADIDLEAEWNTILILWTPPENENNDSTLSMQWRDRQGNPEVEFDFDSANAV